MNGNDAFQILNKKIKQIASGITNITNTGSSLVFTTSKGTITVPLTGLSDNNFTTVLKSKLEGMNDTVLNLLTYVDSKVYFDGKELLYSSSIDLTQYYTKSEIDTRLNTIATQGVDLAAIADGASIQVVNNKLVATTLDGLTVTIAQLNNITNLTSAMRFKTSVATKAALTAITTHVAGDVYVVLADESRDGGQYSYVYGADSTWVCLGVTTIDVSKLVPTTRTVNGKSLVNDVTLVINDLLTLTNTGTKFLRDDGIWANPITTEWTAWTPIITCPGSTFHLVNTYVMKGLYRVVGKNLQLKFVYSHTNNSGYNEGSGSIPYQISIPAGYQIDTTKANVPSLLSSVTGNGAGRDALSLGTSSFFNGAVPVCFAGKVVALSATTLGIHHMSAASLIPFTLWGCGNSYYGGASVELTFTAEIPIV